MNLAGIYAQMKQRDKALESLEEALHSWPEDQKQDSRIEFLAAVAGLFEDLGVPARAFELFQDYERKVLAKGADGFPQYPSFIGRMARVEDELQMFREARTHLETALALREAARSRIASPELRASVLAPTIEIYKIYIDVLMKQHALAPREGHDAEAFAVSERARAAALIASLSDAMSGIREGVNPDLLAQRRKLQDNLNEVAILQRQAEAAGASGVRKVQSAKTEGIRLIAELELLHGKIRRSSPAYASLTEPEPLNVEEIRNQVLESDTMLLEYSLRSDEAGYAFAVTKDSLHSYPMPSASSIDRVARRVRESIAAPQLRPNGETTARRDQRLKLAETQYKRAAAELSRMILRPLENLKPRQRLLIVADGPLNFVPFAALPDPKTGALLVTLHEIVRLPSASALAAHRREVAARGPAALAALPSSRILFSTHATSASRRHVTPCRSVCRVHSVGYSPKPISTFQDSPSRIGKPMRSWLQRPKAAFIKHSASMPIAVSPPVRT